MLNDSLFASLPLASDNSAQRSPFSSSTTAVSSPDDLLAAAGVTLGAPEEEESLLATSISEPPRTRSGKTPKMPKVVLRPEDAAKVVDVQPDIFSMWVGGEKNDPVLLGRRSPDTKVVNPYVSYMGEGVKAVSLAGKLFTRDQISQIDGGRSLLYYMDKLASGEERTALTALREVYTERKWTKFVPYIGMIADIGGSIRTAAKASATFEKLQKGEDVGLDELVAAHAVHARSLWESQTTTGGLVTDIATDLPMLCVSFNISGKVSSALTKQAAKVMPFMKPHVLLSGATKHVGKTTTGFLSTTAVSALKSGDDKVIREAATQISGKLLGSVDDSLVSESAAAVLKNLQAGKLTGFATTEGLTSAGKEITKAAMLKSMTAAHTNAKAFAAVHSKTTSKLYGLVARGSDDQLAAGLRSYADDVAKATGRTADWADDHIKKVMDSFHKGDFFGANSAIGTMVDAGGKATAVEGAVGQASMDAIKKYVDQYMDITYSKPGVKSWYMNKLLRARDAAVTGLNDSGLALVGDGSAFVGHNVRSNLAHALGVLTIEAPIRGAVHTAIGQGARSLVGALATAGSGYRAVGRNELAVRESAYYSGDEEMMEDAFWIGLGMDYSENVSEATGEAFTSIGRAIAKSAPMKGLHKYLSAWVRPGEDAIERVSGDILAKDRQSGMFMRRMISRFVDGDTSWTNHLNSQTSAIYRTIQKSESAFEKAMNQAGHKISMASLREAAERAGAKDTTLFITKQLWQDARLRKGALDASKKYMSAKALTAMHLRDLAAKMSTVKGMGWFGQMFSPTTRKALGMSIGWSGMFQEWLEERANGLLSGFFGWNPKSHFEEGQDPGLDVIQRVKNACGGFLPETMDQFWAEVIAFSIPGATASVINRAQMAVADGPLAHATSAFERLDTVINNAAHSVIKTGSAEQATELADRVNTQYRERIGDASAPDIATVSGSEVSVQMKAPGHLFEGTNAQAPAEEAEVDSIIDNIVDVALEDSRIFNETRGTLLNHRASRIAYRFLGMLNFALTGNFNAVRLDPYMSIARNWAGSSDFLRHTRLNMTAWKKEAMDQALKDVAPGISQGSNDKVLEVLSQRRKVDPKDPNSLQKIQEEMTEKLTPLLTQITKEQCADIIRRVDSAVQERIREYARSLIASRGLLRLSYGDELDRATHRVLSDIVGPTITEQLEKRDRDDSGNLTINLPKDAIPGLTGITVSGNVKDTSEVLDLIINKHGDSLSRIRQDIMARFLDNAAQGKLYFNDADREYYNLGDESKDPRYLGREFAPIIMALDSVRQGKTMLYTQALDTAVASLVSSAARADVVLTYDNVDEAPADVLAHAGFSVPQDTIRTLGALYRAARDNGGSTYNEDLVQFMHAAATGALSDEEFTEKLASWKVSNAQGYTKDAVRAALFDFADRAGVHVGSDITPVIQTIVRNAAEIENFLTTESETIPHAGESIANPKYWRHSSLARDTEGQPVIRPAFKVEADGKTMTATIPVYTNEGEHVGTITVPFTKQEIDGAPAEWYATKDVAKVVAALFDYDMGHTSDVSGIKEAINDYDQSPETEEEDKAPRLLGAILNSLSFERATREIVFSPVTYLNVTDARVATVLLRNGRTGVEFMRSSKIRDLNKAQKVKVGFGKNTGKTRVEDNGQIYINIAGGQAVLNALDDAEAQLKAVTKNGATPQEDALFTLRGEPEGPAVLENLTFSQLKLVADAASLIRSAAEDAAARTIRVTGATQNGKTVYPINVMALSSDSHLVFPFDAAKNSDIGTALTIESLRLRARYAALDSTAREAVGAMVNQINPTGLLNQLRRYVENEVLKETQDKDNPSTTAQLLQRLLDGPLSYRREVIHFDELAPILTYIVLGHGNRAFEGKAYLSEDASWGALSDVLSRDTLEYAREIKRNLALLTVLIMNPTTGTDEKGNYTVESFRASWETAVRRIMDNSARRLDGSLYVDPMSFWGFTLEAQDLEKGNAIVSQRLEAIRTRSAALTAEIDRNNQKLQEAQAQLKAAEQRQAEEMAKREKLTPEEQAEKDRIEKTIKEAQDKIDELEELITATYRELVGLRAEQDENNAFVKHWTHTTPFDMFEKALIEANYERLARAEAGEEPTVARELPYAQDTPVTSAIAAAPVTPSEFARSLVRGGQVAEGTGQGQKQDLDDGLADVEVNNDDEVEDEFEFAAGFSRVAEELDPASAHLALASIGALTWDEVTREALTDPNGTAASFSGAFASLSDRDITVLDAYLQVFKRLPAGKDLLEGQYPRRENFETDKDFVDSFGDKKAQLELFDAIETLSEAVATDGLLNSLRKIASVVSAEAEEENEDEGSAAQDDSGYNFNDANATFLKSSSVKALKFVLEHIGLLPQGNLGGAIERSIAAFQYAATRDVKLPKQPKSNVDVEATSPNDVSVKNFLSLFHRWCSGDKTAQYALLGGNGLALGAINNNPLVKDAVNHLNTLAKERQNDTDEDAIQDFFRLTTAAAVLRFLFSEGLSRQARVDLITRLGQGVQLGAIQIRAGKSISAGHEKILGRPDMKFILPVLREAENVFSNSKRGLLFVKEDEFKSQVLNTPSFRLMFGRGGKADNAYAAVKDALGITFTPTKTGDRSTASIARSLTDANALDLASRFLAHDSFEYRTADGKDNASAPNELTEGRAKSKNSVTNYAGADISNYVSQFRTGLKTVGTAGNRKGVPLFSQLSPRQRDAAETLLKEFGDLLAGDAKADYDKNLPRLIRNATWSYNKAETPMFHVAINEPFYFQDRFDALLNTMPPDLRASANGRASAAPGFTYFQLYTGDRDTHTILSVPFELVRAISQDIDAGLYDWARPSWASLTAKSDEVRYSWIHKILAVKLGYTGMATKRNAAISSNAPTVPLATDESGTSLMAVCLTNTETPSDGEGDFGNAYLYPGAAANGREDVIKDIFNSSGATTKVHVVYRPSANVEKLISPTTSGVPRGGFAKANYDLWLPGKSARYGIGTDKSIRAEALMKVADNWDGRKLSLVAADLDSHKVSLMDLVISDVLINTTRETGESTDGTIPAGQPKLTGGEELAGFDGKTVKELLQALSRRGEEMDNAALDTVSFVYNGERMSLAEIFQGAKLVTTIPSEDSKAPTQMALVFEVQQAEAIRAANLGHAPTVHAHEEPVNLPHDSATAAALISSDEGTTGLAKDLATLYYQMDSELFAFMADTVHTSTLVNDIIRKDAELADAVDAADGHAGLARDIALRVSSAMSKAVRVDSQTLKSTLVTCGEKITRNKQGDLVRDGRRDAVNQFFVRDEERLDATANGKDGKGKVRLGWARANINATAENTTGAVRYGMFFVAKNKEDSVDGVTLAGKQLIRRRIADLMGLQKKVRAASTAEARDAARKSLLAAVEGSFVDYTGIKGHITTWFNEYTPLQDLLGDYAEGPTSVNKYEFHSEYEEDPIVEVAKDTAVRCTGVDHAPSESFKNVSAFVPGSFVTFPRTPSQNMGPQFITLRVTAPAVFDDSNGVAQEAVIMPPPSATFELGADHDGDSTTILIGSKLNGVHLVPGSLQFLDHLKKTIQTLREARELVARLNSKPGSENFKLQPSELKYIRATGRGKSRRYHLSNKLEAMAAASFATWYQTLSLIRSSHFEYDGWEVGVSKLLNKDTLVPAFEPSGDIAYHRMDGKNPDLLDARTAMFVMFSGGAAQKARGAAVACMGSILGAAQIGFVPGVIFTDSAASNAADAERFALKIKRFVQMARVGDGLANALFDDLKEQIAYRYRLTPETIDVVFGLIMQRLWTGAGADTAKQADDIASQVLAEFLTYIDGNIDKHGRYRKAFSGVFGNAFKETAGLAKPPEDVNNKRQDFLDAVRSGASWSGKTPLADSWIDGLNLASDPKFAGVREILTKSRFLQLCLYEVAEGSQKGNGNAIAALTTVLRGALLMHQCRAVTPYVRPQKAKIDSIEYRTVAESTDEPAELLYGRHCVMVSPKLLAPEVPDSIRTAAAEDAARAHGFFVVGSAGGASQTRIKASKRIITDLFQVYDTVLGGIGPSHVDAAARDLQDDEAATLYEIAGESTAGETEEVTGDSVESSDYQEVDEDGNPIYGAFDDEYTSGTGTSNTSTTTVKKTKSTVRFGQVITNTGDAIKLQEVNNKTASELGVVVPSGASYRKLKASGTAAQAEQIRDAFQKFAYVQAVYRFADARAAARGANWEELCTQVKFINTDANLSSDERFLAGVDQILIAARIALRAKEKTSEGLTDLEQHFMKFLNVVAGSAVGRTSKSFPAPRVTGVDPIAHMAGIRESVAALLTEANTSLKLLGVPFAPTNGVAIPQTFVGHLTKAFDNGVAQVRVDAAEAVFTKATFGDIVSLVLLANAMCTRASYKPGSTTLSLLSLLPKEEAQKHHRWAGVLAKAYCDNSEGATDETSRKIRAFAHHVMGYEPLRRIPWGVKDGHAAEYVRTTTAYTPFFNMAPSMRELAPVGTDPQGTAPKGSKRVPLAVSRQITQIVNKQMLTDVKAAFEDKTLQKELGYSLKDSLVAAPALTMRVLHPRKSADDASCAYVLTYSTEAPNSSRGVSLQRIDVEAIRVDTSEFNEAQRQWFQEVGPSMIAKVISDKILSVLPSNTKKDRRVFSVSVEETGNDVDKEGSGLYRVTIGPEFGAVKLKHVLRALGDPSTLSSGLTNAINEALKKAYAANQAARKRNEGLAVRLEEYKTKLEKKRAEKKAELADKFANDSNLQMYKTGVTASVESLTKGIAERKAFDAKRTEKFKALRSKSEAATVNFLEATDTSTVVMTEPPAVIAKSLRIFTQQVLARGLASPARLSAASITPEQVAEEVDNIYRRIINGGLASSQEQVAGAMPRITDLVETMVGRELTDDETRMFRNHVAAYISAVFYWHKSHPLSAFKEGGATAERDPTAGHREIEQAFELGLHSIRNNSNFDRGFGAMLQNVAVRARNLRDSAAQVLRSIIAGPGSHGSETFTDRSRLLQAAVMLSALYYLNRMVNPDPSAASYKMAKEAGDAMAPNAERSTVIQNIEHSFLSAFNRVARGGLNTADGDALFKAFGNNFLSDRVGARVSAEDVRRMLSDIAGVFRKAMQDRSYKARYSTEPATELEAAIDVLMRGFRYNPGDAAPVPRSAIAQLVEEMLLAPIASVANPSGQGEYIADFFANPDFRPEEAGEFNRSTKDPQAAVATVAAAKTAWKRTASQLTKQDGPLMSFLTNVREVMSEYQYLGKLAAIATQYGEAPLKIYTWAELQELADNGDLGPRERTFPQDSDKQGEPTITDKELAAFNEVIDNNTMGDYLDMSDPLAPLPVDEVTESLYLYDPALAFDHFVAPRYGRFNLRETVLFSSGEEVVSELHNLQNFLGNMFGVLDYNGRISRVEEVEAESGRFEKGMFRVTTQEDGKARIIRFRENSEASIVTSMAGRHVMGVLSNSDRLAVSMYLKALASELLGGSDAVYTSVGSATRFGLDFKLTATDIGLPDGKGGIVLNREHFMGHYDMTSVDRRFDALSTSRTSNFDNFMYCLYNALPENLVSDVAKAVLEAVWEAGSKAYTVINDTRKAATGGVVDASLWDDAISEAVTKAVKVALQQKGLAAVSKHAKHQKSNAALVTLTIPNSMIYDKFKQSEAFSKLIAAGRKAEWLSPEAIRAQLAPAIHRLNMFRLSNPSLTMGDLAGITGFDSYLWLSGKDGMFRPSGRLARMTMYEKEGTIDVQLAKEAARFSASLGAHKDDAFVYQSAVSKDTQEPRYLLKHGAHNGVFTLYVDKCVEGSRTAEVEAIIGRLASGKTGVSQKELDRLGISLTDTLHDVVARTQNALLRELYMKAVPDIQLPVTEYPEGEFPKLIQVPRSALAFIRGYEMLEDNAKTHRGLTIKDAFDLEGVLPDDQDLIGQINGLARRVLDACSFTGTLHNMMSTMSEEGLPNYLVCPEERRFSDELFDDRMWGELAQWYIRVFSAHEGESFQGLLKPEIGFAYNTTQSGRENCRRICKILQNQDFVKNKYTNMDDSTEANYATMLKGVESIGCFIPNRASKSGNAEDSDYGVADDTHSALTSLSAKSSEAYGMLRKVLDLRASARQTNGNMFDKINAWSKSCNVAWSWFFQIATVFESQVAASGFLNTVAGLFKSGANWKRNRKNPDLLQDGAGKIRHALGGQSLADRQAEDPNAGLDNLCALSWADIAEMWNSNHPFLLQLKQFCSSIGVTMTRPEDYSAYYDQNGKVAAGMFEKLADRVARAMHSDEEAAAASAARIASLLKGFFNTNHSIDAFGRLMDVTKMAVTAQICAKLRAQAIIQGIYFDPIREMRKIGNYINEEIGGINPLAHAFDTPTARKWMSRMLFSWTWTMGSWSAGGGTLLTNALLGGDATNATYRAHMWGRWLRMGGWVMYGVPMMVQMLSNAVARLLYAAAGTDDDDQMEMTWLMQNNEEKLSQAADITPLLHSLMKVDEKIFGDAHGIRMAKLGKYGAPARVAATFLPMYTGDNTTGRRRFGVHWGKQAHEITGGWFSAPAQTLMGKLSRPLQVGLEEVFGITADPNFPAKHIANHEEGLDRFRVGGSLLENVFGMFAPFSVSTLASDSYTKEPGLLVAATSPVNIGLSKMLASQRVEQELRHAAEQSPIWQGPANIRRSRARVAKVLADAARNGYSPQKIFTKAKQTVVTDYYRDLYNALPKTADGPVDEARLQRACRALRFLGTKKKGATTSVRNRMRDANKIIRADDPLYARIMLIVDEAFGHNWNLDAYRSGGLSTIEAPKLGDSRMAAKAGYSTMGDGVPKSVFGMPVSVSQRGEFDEYPEAAGLYRVSEGRDTYMGPMPRSIFGMRVEAGNEDSYSTRPYAGGNDAVPQSIFGIPVVTRGLDGADRARSKREGSFFDPREKLAIDDVPSTVFGLPVAYEAHKAFEMMPNSAGFYQLGSVGRLAMRRRTAPESIFGMPVSMEIEPQDI